MEGSGMSHPQGQGGGGGGMTPVPPQHEQDGMLDVYVLDYFQKRGFHQVAEAFQKEANVSPTTPIEAPQGFLFEWWSVFWDVFIARTNPSRASDSANLYVEAQQLKQLQQQQQQFNPYRWSHGGGGGNGMQPEMAGQGGRYDGPQGMGGGNWQSGPPKSSPSPGQLMKMMEQEQLRRQMGGVPPGGSQVRMGGVRLSADGQQMGVPGMGGMGGGPGQGQQGKYMDQMGGMGGQPGVMPGTPGAPGGGAPTGGGPRGGMGMMMGGQVHDPDMLPYR